MLQLRSFWLCAALFLVTFFNLGAVNAVPSGRYAIQRRDDATSTASSFTSSSRADSTESSVSASGSMASKMGSSHSASATFSFSSTSTQVQTSTTIPTLVATAAGSVDTGTFNSTLTPDLLPITPETTPAFSVAGVLLMIVGCIYAFVGIKWTTLQIFISTLLLTSLSITVLIIYIMNPPVSYLVQGAYLAAIVVPGLIVGSLAIVFADMTVGFGCVLGGFCFSMWLLVLRRGGLITTTSGICGLIAALCVAFLFTRAHRYTRPYGLIVSFSFSGATAIVLGIDCFSRAGLKEFWAWIWNLNNNLFPLGATTYPITKGMRVEIAAIIVIFLAGTAVQVKLWQVISKEKGESKLKRDSDEESREREERDVGKRIEERTAPDRDHWEATYGEGEKYPTKRNHPPSSINDSGVGDLDSLKVSRSSMQRRSTDDDGIEPAGVGKPSESVMSLSGKDSIVTVRVAQDEIETIPEFEDDEQHDKRYGSDPHVIPLPFQVPSDPMPSSSDDKSSVATFNDDEPNFDTPQAQSKGFSASGLWKRLSKTAIHNSQQLLGLSVDASTGWSKLSHSRAESRPSSVAATIDGISDKDSLEPLDPVMTANLPLILNSRPMSSSAESKKRMSRPVSMSLIELQRTSVGEVKKPMNQEKRRSKSVSLEASIAIKKMQDDSKIGSAAGLVAPELPPQLTEELLPSTLTKVEMSYRTNEWAKHLSRAESPPAESLHIGRTRPRAQNPEEGQEAEDIDTEKPAPVDFYGLQQTATNATPPPAPRLSSRSRMQAPPQTHLTQGRQKSNTARSSVHRRASGRDSLSSDVDNNTSRNSMGRGRNTSNPSVVPVYAHHASTGSTSTLNLMTQRRSIMKNKHLFTSLKPLAPTPEGGALASGGTTPTSAACDSSSNYSDSWYDNEKKLSGDDISLRERKRLLQQRESYARSTSSPFGNPLSPRHSKSPTSPNYNIKSPTSPNFNPFHRSLSRESSLGSAERPGFLPPAKRSALMASWRASIQEDLYGSGGGGGGGMRRSSSGAMTNGKLVMAPKTTPAGKLSMVEERAMDFRRQRLFEERQREGLGLAKMREEEARVAEKRDRMVRSGVLGGGSSVEGAHREIMRRLQKRVVT